MICCIIRYNIYFRVLLVLYRLIDIKNGKINVFLQVFKKKITVDDFSRNHQLLQPFLLGLTVQLSLLPTVTLLLSLL